MRRLRVTIVLPFLHLTGGIRMMLDHANGLHRSGHDVLVVYPAWPYRFHFTRRQIVHEFRDRVGSPVRVEWFRLEAPLRRVPWIAHSFLPPADAVVATSWPTVRDVWRLGRSCGTKVHVVMHHERGTGPDEAVDATYRWPFHRITLSEGTRQCLSRDHGVLVHDVVPAGVDPALFHPGGERQPMVVVMPYHPEPRKGAADGFAAFAALRRRVPQARCVAFGPLRPDYVPEATTFVHQPPDADLRALYAGAAVVLYPSRLEGFGLPPLEAMACGCPVVSTEVGAVPEFAGGGDHALLVAPGDVEGLATALERVLGDPALRTRLSSAGIEVASRYTTTLAAARLDEVLARVVPPARREGTQ